jgi:Uma2 family endonuclease
LIDGIAYMMSAPSTSHQRISMSLSRQLSTFLMGKQCEVFAAPCDVCLNGLGDEDDTVVQPDLLVVCDESKIDKKRCNGAPDMTIEILSPSTSRRDLFLKLEKYEKAGVREYWVVDPDAKTVKVHILTNGQYVISSYESDDTVPVSVLDGCSIELTEVF